MVVFPNAKIAVVGASEAAMTLDGNPSPNRVQQWNNQILPFVANAKAFTFHAQYPINTNNTNLIKLLQTCRIILRHL